MKLTVKDGVISATAETLADMQALFTLTANGSKKSVGRPAGATKAGYKKECAVCGRKVKHIQLHVRRNHASPASPASSAAITSHFEL